MDYENDVFKLDCKINNLEEEIKCVKRINRKSKVIRNLKVFSGGIRSIYPYLITGGIVFGTFSFFGSTPHYNDSIKADSLKIIDSNGVSKYVYIEDYDISSESNIIKKYSKWNKNEEGIYVREVKTYTLPISFSENKIKNIVLDDDVELDKKFELSSCGIDENTSLSKEELSMNYSYMEAYIFNSENHKSFIKESDEKNKYNTISFYVLFIMFSVFIKLFRDKMINGFKLKKYIEKLHEKYPNIDIDLLLKELDCLKKEYNNLVRKR